MDTEQQIRLNFLDEAEEYFDRMESSSIGLADTMVDAQKVDLVLRSAHSIKGGAAMMKFDTLSRVAHRLEDFLKVLRVRHAASMVDVEVETALLQSIDVLRYIASQNRQGHEVTESEIGDRIQPLLNTLKQHLGELEEADENALLAEDEDIDPAVLIFEEGVDGVLDRFESQIGELGIAELAQELTATAQELIGFGMMADLESFTQLCESIQEQANILASAELPTLAEQALKTWRRSHALVMRGSTDKLPSSLEIESTILDSTTATVEPNGELLTDDDSTLDPLATSLELENLSAFELDSEESLELELQSAFDFDSTEEAIDTLILDNLQSAFTAELPEPTTAEPQPQAKELPTVASEPTPSVNIEDIDKMVRVPVSQLQQFNTLFEQLVLNRNSINLRLQQFQDIVVLMGQRIAQMEESNTQLKQWYDRASLEGFLGETAAIPANSANTSSLDAITKQSDRSNETASLRFDSLEMDRYTDIHLICQEQIETIVQLQEVATDIRLGIQEIDAAVRDLNYTTKSMQGNVTRTQMLPFAEAVKRFPRVIRDLNLQFDKQVELTITGQNTLLDRSVIEALSDPLMHLLRNAFDHGIEDPETRIAAGKSATGTIAIAATTQGTYSVITLTDDGGGISLDKIRDRAMQMGFSREEVARIPEAELLDFIFEPGFSTAKQVTELSGRGVGMDVVRTNLQEVRGDVRVATALGKGTTFTLKIPFTLSILKVAIIEQAGIIFAIPANSIRELITLTPELVRTSEDAKYLIWNQTEIPLVEIEKTLVYRRPHQATELTGNPAIDCQMALAIGDGKTFSALQIDRFWHEQESTIRSIDSPVPLPPGVVSSAIFGDGKVIPLFDPQILIEHCLTNTANEEDNYVPVETSNRARETTILVVDDSINVRRYLSLTLEKAGYRVEQAKDGREAVDKLLGGLEVDGAICDIEMPRLDGYGVLEEIKGRSEFADLPIAMLTSRSNEKHRKVAMNLGASAYFSKPYNEQELLAELAKLVGK